MALFDSTLLYLILPASTLLYHGTTSVYITLPWLYMNILDIRLFYYGYTWL